MEAIRLDCIYCNLLNLLNSGETVCWLCAAAVPAVVYYSYDNGIWSLTPNDADPSPSSVIPTPGIVDFDIHHDKQMIYWIGSENRVNYMILHVLLPGSYRVAGFYQQLKTSLLLLMSWAFITAAIHWLWADIVKGLCITALFVFLRQLSLWWKLCSAIVLWLTVFYCNLIEHSL